jgi:hypothetical protein
MESAVAPIRVQGPSTGEYAEIHTSDLHSSHPREYATLEISIMKQISDMLKSTAGGAMLVNEDGIVILWNKAAERLPGFLVRDVIRRSFGWTGASIALGRGRKSD